MGLCQDQKPRAEDYKSTRTGRDELQQAFANILPRVELESLKRNPERFKRNFTALERMWEGESDSG